MTRDKPIDSVLGKNTTNYKSNYDPDVLVSIKRSNDRSRLDLREDTLPFVGFDVLHAYEASFLTGKGLPVNGILKLIIPANSTYIVESKSLKLYLFSFAMQSMGKNKEEATANYLKTVKEDLTKVLECPIKLSFFDVTQAVFEKDPILIRVKDLDYVVDLDTLVFDKYTESPDTLEVQEGLSSLFIKTDLLKSNCKITHQCDYATIYIQIKGSSIPSPESIAKYIVSMRGENHFHEEIVECVYSRLWNKFQPKDLMVCALYTRRGGIDICPVRTSSADLVPPFLVGESTLLSKEYRS